MRIQISGRTITMLAVAAIISGSFLAQTGCGKQSKHAGLSDAVVAELHKFGQIQEAGCQDDLNDVFFVSPTTLPAGAAAPAKDVSGAGFAVGKANTILTRRSRNQGVGGVE